RPPGPSGPGWPPGPSGPGGGGALPNAPSHPSAPGSDLTPLTVPYNRPLPDGLRDKVLITICGSVKPNADKITVDLCAGTDIAFHFNPRFNEYGQKVIVRNTRIKNQWGKEERPLQNFPFGPGKPFEIKILCTNSEYKVAVNNSHLLEYKHRIPNLKSINALKIYNDVDLTKVDIEMLH
ncbi:galectin-3b, partial [Plectropomus leopardus]|uniref:galectin-3b n=1 Tax=Plectropomus leopardus TaxID=160734 RepID=UPI001C4D3AC4